MSATLAYAAFDPNSPLRPFNLERRAPGPRDVQLEILFCGVCHSDLHTARSEWNGTIYPVVPGHEIVGRVTRVGPDVTKFALGDLVGVGCMVDSCRSCSSCDEGLEQYCEGNGKGEGLTLTYNSPDKHAPGKPTYGGYSSQIVVDEHFCLRISDKLQLPAVAPLLCAGITVYSPLKHFGATTGKKVGIVGLGGLGHMGVKLARAFGAHTVLFTTSPEKTSDAKELGANEVVVSKNPSEMQSHRGTFDLIIDTVSAAHDLDAYTSLLARDGTLVLVGLPENPHPSPSVGNLLSKRRRIAGSMIGSIRETQEMLDFCAERGIVSNIELVPIQKIDEAYERMLRGDVKYRFVIDMASLGAGRSSGS